MTQNPKDAYDEAETVRRREDALKRMLNTPHKPHKPTDKKKAAVKKREESKG